MEKLDYSLLSPAIFSACGSPCWRGPPRKAFVFRHATPTGPGLSAPAAAHVGVDLPAKPLTFVTPRQHRRLFLGARSPMLAWASPQSLCPSPRHANRARIFRAGGSPCWRGPPRKALVLRHATPTGPGLSAPAAAHVGVGRPAKPLSFVTPRQQGPDFPRRRQPMLAWASLQSLCPSSRHANTGAFSSARGRPCWRGPPCKAFDLRHATPTGPGLSAPAAAHVGVDLPAKPLTFVTPRQHRRLFLSPVLHKKLCCI